MTWELLSGYEKNKAKPYTYYIPSKWVIGKLEIGHKVKLLFEGKTYDGEAQIEKMWVEITEQANGVYKGNLLDQPVMLEGLFRGTQVTFEVEHIIDTELQDNTLKKWDYYFDNRILVSQDVLDRKEYNIFVKSKVSKAIEGKLIDTGCIVLSGYENKEYLEDVNNFQFIAIGVILNIDNSILKYVDKNPRSLYIRDKEGNFKLKNGTIVAKGFN